MCLQEGPGWLDLQILLLRRYLVIGDYNAWSSHQQKNIKIAQLEERVTYLDAENDRLRRHCDNLLETNEEHRRDNGKLRESLRFHDTFLSYLRKMIAEAQSRDGN